MRLRRVASWLSLLGMVSATLRWWHQMEGLRGLGSEGSKVEETGTPKTREHDSSSRDPIALCFYMVFSIVLTLGFLDSQCFSSPALRCALAFALRSRDSPQAAHRPGGTAGRKAPAENQPLPSSGRRLDKEPPGDTILNQEISGNPKRFQKIYK